MKRVLGAFGLAWALATSAWVVAQAPAGAPFPSGGHSSTASDLSCTDCVSVAEIAEGTAGQLLISDATPTTAWATMSGDATLSSAGALAIAADSVALGTDTTGSYAAGDAEAGNATGLSCTGCVSDTDLASTTVVAATYYCADVTVDADGRITTAASAPWVAIISLSPSDSNLTTGTNVFTLSVPSRFNGWKLHASPLGVRAHVGTASSSGLPTITLTKATAASSYVTTAVMLSTSLTVDANERDSNTAATPAVVDAANNTLAQYDEIQVNVTVAGTGTRSLTLELDVVPP